MLGQWLVNFADNFTGAKDANDFGVAVVLAVDDAHHVMPLGAHAVIAGAAAFVDEELGAARTVGLDAVAVMQCDPIFELDRDRSANLAADWARTRTLAGGLE